MTLKILAGTRKELFGSGANQVLNEILWARPGRCNWIGSGYDWPGIHSICINSKNRQEATVALSVGGIFQTTNNAET
jgi:hypothetical protein